MTIFGRLIMADDDERSKERSAYEWRQFMSTKNM